MPKISDLPADTAPDPADLLAMVDVTASRTESVTVANLAASTAFAGQYAPSDDVSPRSALYLPATSGNYVSTPDAASLDITGDLTLMAHLSLDDWTPSGQVSIVGKRNSSSQNSYRLSVAQSVSGTLTLVTSPDGTDASQLLISSTATVQSAAGISDGDDVWVAVAFQPNDGSGNRVTKFYWAASQLAVPTSWTQIGSTVTTASTTSIFASTSTVEVGSTAGGTGQLVAGKIHRAVIADGIGASVTPGGTIVADYRSDLPAGSRYRDVTGKVWTINGSAWSWTLGKV